jgi:hypothetical protein
VSRSDALQKVHLAEPLPPNPAGDCPWTSLFLALVGAGWLSTYVISLIRMLVDLARPGISVRPVPEQRRRASADVLLLRAAEEVWSQAGRLGW